MTNFYSFDTKSKNKFHVAIILVQFGMLHDNELHIMSSKIISVVQRATCAPTFQLMNTVVMWVSYKWQHYFI